jgi:Na+-transporting methylmalonyl-CoA/oxaloacetate decarboxylase gamma subunit
MGFVIVLAILTLVVLFVSAPLRRSAAAEPPSLDEELAELEAARAAKYREIRDAELDHRTGKLSDSDFAEIDQELRAEAIGLMRELDRAQQLPSHET